MFQARELLRMPQPQPRGFETRDRRETSEPQGVHDSYRFEVLADPLALSSAQLTGYSGKKIKLKPSPSSSSSSSCVVAPEGPERGHALP